MENQEIVSLAADIVSAHVANNAVAVGDLPNLIQNVYSALAGLAAPSIQTEAEPKKPVVSVRASVKPDYIVCMECGTKQKMLKRHLRTAHGTTPDQYRQDYGLPSSYPMVAPNYSEQRRRLAHAIGLGRKRENPTPAPASKEPAAPKRRRRTRKAPAAKD